MYRHNPGIYVHKNDNEINKTGDINSQEYHTIINSGKKTKVYTQEELFYMSGSVDSENETETPLSIDLNDPGIYIDLNNN